MKRLAFLEKTNHRPVLTCVTCDRTPEDCIATIRNAIYDGADAFLIDLGKLNPEYQNRETYRQIFAFCEDLPVITMHYRSDLKPEITDQMIADNLRQSIEAGAAMCDVFGDLFHPSPRQLSTDEESIRRQKEFVSQIHAAGGHVMMSSHTWAFLTPEETVQHALALVDRGADMIKLAVIARNEEETWQTYQATHALEIKTEIPYLHVCMGQYGKGHRAIAPLFGSSMILCVQQYTGRGHREQPLLKAMKTLYDSLDCGLARDSQLGTVHQSSVQH